MPIQEQTYFLLRQLSQNYIQLQAFIKKCTKTNYEQNTLLGTFDLVFNPLMTSVTITQKLVK